MPLSDLLQFLEMLPKDTSLRNIFNVILKKAGQTLCYQICFLFRVLLHPPET